MTTRIEQLARVLEITQELAALILKASQQLANVSQIAARVQAEEREFTSAEWVVITEPSDVEIANLQQAIAIRKNPNTRPAPATTVTETTVTHPVARETPVDGVTGKVER